MKLAYPGSFDPFTNGHLHIVKKGLSLEPGTEVVVIVAANSSKKNHFSGEERVEMIKKSVEGLTGVSVELLPPYTYTVHYAEALRCDAMLRAMRTEPDFQDECGIYQTNRRISNMETIYVMPDINLSSVRSSIAMGLVGPSKWTFTVSEFVPKPVMLQICKKFCGEVVPLSRISSPCSYDTSSYHNWEHIAYCLSEFRKFTGKIIKPVEIGIFLHDLFDPSDLTELHKFLDVNNDLTNFTEMVEDIVSATNHKDVIDFSKIQFQEWAENAKLVHDIDLSVLSWPWERYKEYSSDIYNEYSKKYSKEVFTDGRVAFIKSLLKKGKIFLLNHYSEEDARENLKKELNCLMKSRGYQSYLEKRNKDLLDTVI